MVCPVKELGVQKAMEITSSRYKEALEASEE